MSVRLNQELASYSSRFGNLQASLLTWMDHVLRLEHISEQCEEKMTFILNAIDEIKGKLADEKSPATFNQLKQLIKNLEVCL